MSAISDIFQSYEGALSLSREQYTALYADRVENGRQFYEEFFHHLVRPLRPVFDSSASRAFLTRKAERFFNTSHINFVAIDGTCLKDTFAEFAVFFGGAYGARGRVSLEGDPAKVRYEKWEMNRDVSLVAWVPIPFAELPDVDGADVEETFMTSETDRVNLSALDTSLMQLAEIYLAYNVATGSSIDAPHLILLDQSLSSIMAASSHGANTGLVGYPYDRRMLDAADVTIAFAHPFNTELGIPSTKKFRRYTSILAQFDARKTQHLTIDELAESLELTVEEIKDAGRYLIKIGLCDYDKSTRVLTTRVDVRESWAYTVSLFQNICTRLFVHKDPSALTYEVTNEEGTRRRWMSPDDIQFLIAVGLRALVENCWQKRILLVGIVKDSASRYLTRNYLGVMKHVGLYPQLSKLHVAPLPWTDRIYLETLPVSCDDTLNAPWATVEFDSSFMTLSLGREKDGRAEIRGVRVQGGEMVAPERLFLRSLGQFYLNRDKRTPLMGHVVFIDRLAFPIWDKGAWGGTELYSDSLGHVAPLVYADREAPNDGQTLTMYLLNTLTRNHFPEMIGYPDPLHKADWGAKSVARRVRGMIQSSELPFRARPIARTLRDIRDSHGR